MRIIGLVLVFVLVSYAAAEDGNLADRLKALEDERAKLETEINLYREKAKHLLDIFRNVLKDEDTDSPSSDEPITKRQLACNTAASQIVFHSRLLRQREFASVNEDIVFDIVHTNIGGGYNSSNGIFTAPRRGNYQLMASTMATDGNSTDIRIVRSSHYPYNICNTHAGTSHSSMGLCVALVTLEENENVRVEHYHRSHQVIAGGKFSSFSGHRINDN